MASHVCEDAVDLKYVERSAYKMPPVGERADR